jgi:hypothetical protein
MIIQKMVKAVQSTPDTWVRVLQVRRTPSSMEIYFAVHKGRRGKRIDEWRVTCQGVHEAEITDFDGGGLRFYSAGHPAARQYIERGAELRWSRTCDEARTFLALHRAHMRAAYGWIPFERYLQIETPWTGTSFQPHFAPVSGSHYVCRGPEFLLRTYAKALKSIGEEAKLILHRPAKSERVRPRVLHFGASYVVANIFTAQRAVPAVE